MSDDIASANAQNEIQPTIDIRSEHGLAKAHFIHESMVRGFNFNSFVSRAASISQRNEVEKFGETVSSRATEFLEERVLVLESGSVAKVTLGSGSVDVVVAAASQEQCEADRDRLAATFEAPAEDPAQVPITFWSASKDGGSRAHRKIECAEWDLLKANYCRQARSVMSRLVATKDPDGGRLILWHGPPGTGKTHAVRALSRAWQDWCRVHLVTDPEQFLGSSAYAMDVLTSNDLEAKRNRAWHLVVLEDSGELLRNDAREMTGQALSRLLNLTDGLMGQGLNALVLITTNEPIARLHPAVTRPGRCLENAEFGPLSKSEANRWLEAHACDQRVAGKTSLASLYSISKNLTDPDEVSNVLPTVGFAAVN